MTRTTHTQAVASDTTATTRVSVDRGILVALLAGTIGLVGGPVTLLVEETADSPVVFSAVHSLGPWALVTAWVGMLVRGRWHFAALAGLVTQVGLVLGYYGVKAAFTGPPAFESIVTYTALGVVSGPFFGTAGALLGDRRVSVRTLSLGLVSAPWLADGVRMTMATIDVQTRVVPHLVVAGCFVAVGILLPPVIGRSRRDWVPALAAALGLCAVIVLGLQIL
jgi:hypothetical protein